jgi:ribosome maturation factor RimP
VAGPDPEKALSMLVEPVCAAHGVELVLLKVTARGREGLVQLIIDRPRGEGEDVDGSGVTIDDCQAVSRDVGTALDVHEDLIPGHYRLEVSSPGLERPLVKLDDFERFRGREAKLRVKTPIDGRRKFQGRLLGVDGDVVTLEQDGRPVQLPFGDIDRANLVYRF